MKTMTHMKNLLSAFALSGLLGWAFAADAGTTTFQGVSVDYGNASTNWVNGDLVLTYASSSSLKISGGAVKADVLVVGGGGAGGTGKSSTTNAKYGNGGDGGEVVEKSCLVSAGTLEIAIGHGGTVLASSNANGGDGGETTVKSTDGAFETITAQGGAGGTGNNSSSNAKAGSPTQGVTSEIDGQVYGKGGAKYNSGKTAENGDSNTGNGGQGGRAHSTTSYRKGGDGGSGVVIVRLKAAYAAVTLADMTLGKGEETTSFAEKTAGAPVDIFFSEVSSVSFSPEGVAQATRTKEGRLVLVGTWPGETTVTIEKDKDAVIYTAKVTVTAPIGLQDLTVQRGETSSSLVVRETGVALDLDYDAAKALKSSVSEIADFVKLPNGKIGIVGKLTGTADLTIVTEGQGYECKVTVEKLLSGLYKAGAYEVAVTNASDISYVDGDLVLIYRNVDAAVEKSFKLPKPTTGRLLAVGGGGAGGRDAEDGYSPNYGLPGGGAGGLVINDGQSFEATTYTVSVGAGGEAYGRELVNITKNNATTKTWVPTGSGSGNDGADSVVKKGSTEIVTAKGGGGGGRRGVGKDGGSGGGGSANYSSKRLVSMNGGSGVSGQGNKGGTGANAKFGAGGCGAGGPGVSTTAATVDGSGAGGAGKVCDITGESLEYARGGAGGVPRVYTHYWYDNSGAIKYGNESTAKASGYKYFWVESSDGKPGRDGFGDGGGGSGHYYSSDNADPTFAGRGGNGAVIVRIPPYETTVEDALKQAFAGRPVTVSGTTVTLTGDIAGPVAIPDNLGAVTVNLNGHVIAGPDGAPGDDITPGGNGEPALKIVKPSEQCAAGTTKVHLTGSGTVKGGNGGDGHPQGVGAAALAGEGSCYELGASVKRRDGDDGDFNDQHPHAWEYELFDNKIYANCVADDEETCSYKERERRPMLAFEAADADFTGEPYAGLTLVNTITATTGRMRSGSRGRTPSRRCR